jgi:hypothetical protein
MKIDFEALQRLPVIENKLDRIVKLLESQGHKRWLTSKEAAHYIGYSAETIVKLIKRGDLVMGVHYYRKNRKLIFDAFALDRWVMGIGEEKPPAEIDGIIGEIIEKVKSDAS